MYDATGQLVTGSLLDRQPPLSAPLGVRYARVSPEAVTPWGTAPGLTGIRFLTGIS